MKGKKSTAFALRMGVTPAVGKAMLKDKSAAKPPVRKPKASGK